MVLNVRYSSYKEIGPGETRSRLKNRLPESELNVNVIQKAAFLMRSLGQIERVSYRLAREKLGSMAAIS